jgi:hypothetical protein
MPEWDLVSETVEGKRLLLGETRWSFRPFSGDSQSTPPIPAGMGTRSAG